VCQGLRMRPAVTQIKPSLMCTHTLTLDLLHCLVSCESSQCVHVGLRVQQLPEALSTMAGQGVLDLQAATKLLNVLTGVHAAHTLPTLVVRGGSHVCRGGGSSKVSMQVGTMNALGVQVTSTRTNNCKIQ
jgi:hypothetical protein